MGNLTRHVCTRRKSCAAGDLNVEYLDRMRRLFRHRRSPGVCNLDIAERESFIPFAGRMDTVAALKSIPHEIEEMRSFNRISMLAWRTTGQILRQKHFTFGPWRVWPVCMALAKNRRQFALAAGVHHRDCERKILSCEARIPT